MSSLFCARDHKRVQRGNGCPECHRERARLDARIDRVARTLAKHERECERCAFIRDECSERAELVRRLGIRRRALASWQELGAGTMSA